MGRTDMDQIGTRLDALRREVAAAAQPFMLGGRKVRIVVDGFDVAAYVDECRVSSVGRGYGVNAVADDICLACGVQDGALRVRIAHRVNVVFRSGS